MFTKKLVKLRTGSTLSSANGKLNRSTGLERKGSLITSKQCLATSASAKLTCHAKSGSARLMGDRAESLVQEVFEKGGLLVKETANSGAKNYDGDMVVQMPYKNDITLRLEVKKRNTDSFSVNAEYLSLIKVKALTNGGIPGLVVVNKSNQKLIVFELEDFVGLVDSLTER